MTETRSDVAIDQISSDDAFEGDIGNDIISSSGTSEDSSKSSTLVTLSEATTTASSPVETVFRSKARSLSTSSNKRVVVRKLVNIHSHIGRTTSTLRPSTSKSPETHYVEEAVHQTPINSHRSELLFIEESDAKDLINSESMNVPRIVKLQPSTVTSISTSSSTSFSSVPRTKTVRGTENKAEPQRNLPFTSAQQQQQPSVDSDSRKQASEDFHDDQNDLELNASNNDRLVQEQRMATSRSRSQQIDTKTSSTSGLPTPASVSSPLKTVVYGTIQHSAANPARLPMPRSISTNPIKEQRVAGPLYQAKIYSEPAKIYSEPAKVYSEPAKVYSEPAKIYGQPEKVYSEPAKFYSEPAKVYSEPAKFYSEPAKVYSEPARNYGVAPTPFPHHSTTTALPRIAPSTTQSSRKILSNLDKLPYDLLNAPNKNLDLGGSVLKPTHEWNPSRVNHVEMASQPPKDNKVAVEENAEKEPNQEADLLHSGDEEPETDNLKSGTKTSDNNKSGYVVEGRTYRKYRVEEKTPDGFIVGEYGVVSHNDGNLRGVRYTADSNINPRLIYDALLKFLSLW